MWPRRRRRPRATSQVVASPCRELAVNRCDGQEEHFDSGCEPGEVSAVSDDSFPSGPWIGFYVYGGERGRHRMDLALSFADGTAVRGIREEEATAAAARLSMTSQRCISNRRRIAVKVRISPQFGTSWRSFDKQVPRTQVAENNDVSAGYEPRRRKTRLVFGPKGVWVQLPPGVPTAAATGSATGGATPSNSSVNDR